MDQHFADTFALAGEPQGILRQLVRTCPEFEHLTDARIACLFSQLVLTLHGGRCAALIAKPAYFQGPLRHLALWLIVQETAPLFEWQEPDYLILVDHAIWPVLDGVRREALIYHELCHVRVREHPETGAPMHDDEGRPSLKLVPHDAEKFYAEIERYGVAVTDSEELALAIAEGERRQRVATLKLA